MIYLIGGASRCGKSSLSKAVRQTIAGQAIAGDALRTALRDTTNQESFPTLHWRRSAGLDDPRKYQAYFRDHPAQARENLREEARTLWNFFESYIRAISFESRSDLLLESIDLWPEFFVTLNQQFRAVMLIDTDPEQWKRIIAHRQGSEHDWMQQKAMNETDIKTWARFNAARSEYIAKQAAIYGIRCFDVAHLGYETVQKQALNYLQTGKEILA